MLKWSLHTFISLNKEGNNGSLDSFENGHTYKI